MSKRYVYLIETPDGKMEVGTEAENNKSDAIRGLKNCERWRERGLIIVEYEYREIVIDWELVKTGNTFK